MTFDYVSYVALFNTGDDAALVERFFHDEITFTGGTRIHHGKAELLGFLNWAHDGVREVIRLQTMLRDGDLIFVEVDMDFHATKERADFPFGYLFPGDLVTVKFFVTYRLKDERIVELKSMTWPPEWGVTKLAAARRARQPEGAFLAYASAFSNADHTRFPLFYTEDVTLKLPNLPLIEGRQGIVDFYRPMFETVRETVTVNSLLADDHAISADVISRFTAIADAPDFVVAPLCKGQFVNVPVFVHYTLRDGLISRIRVARAGEPTPPQG